MKNEDPLSSGGSVLLALGAIAFFPPLFDYEFLITSWLGNMQQPVGLSAMLVGGALFGIGKLREFRNRSPVASPTDLDALAQSAVPATEPVPAHEVPASEAEHQQGDRQPV